jgi:hypothetical protein
VVAVSLPKGAIKAIALAGQPEAEGLELAQKREEMVGSRTWLFAEASYLAGLRWKFGGVWVRRARPKRGERGEGLWTASR